MNESASHPTSILRIAAWFGLACGLLEGTLFLVTQQSGRITSVWTDILWISPLFNLLLFSALGGLLLFACGRFPGLPAHLTAVLLFAFLLCLDIALLLGFDRLHPLAILALSAGLAVETARRFRNQPQAFLQFWSRSLPVLGVLTAAAFVGLLGGGWLIERLAIARLPVPAVGAPNVLLIVVDTLRADRLSGSGYSRPTTPGLDRLASEGTLFENAFATSSYSYPSHVSLLTGLYAYEHGAEWDAPQALRRADYPTLAEAMRAAGYRTGGFSANTFWVTREHGFGRGFIHFEDYFDTPADMAFRTLFGRSFERFVLPRLGFDDLPARKRAMDINRSVLDWVGSESEQPFFVFINYMDTHDPYLPPEPYRSMFSSLPKPGGLLNQRIGRDNPDLTPEQVQSEQDAYDGAIAYVDDSIARLLASLKERGLTENTLVIVTSDHGEAFGEHAMFLHANSLHREVIHVPLLVWWPGHIPAGVRITLPVTNAALPATILTLIDPLRAARFPGPSLTRLWEAPASAQDWPDPLAEIAQQDWQPETFPVHHGWIKTLVSPDWQYIEHETLAPELYDWKSDPRQENNLVGQADAGLRLAEFQEKLRKLLSQVQALGIVSAAKR